jgi:hypothetical protein
MLLMTKRAPGVVEANESSPQGDYLYDRKGG